MNTQKFLILIKGEDKTEEILIFENHSNCIYINYKNSQKLYPYSKKDFEFYKDPVEIDLQKNKIVLEQGYIYNVIKVLKFERFYRIFFEDSTSRVIFENNVKIVENTTGTQLSQNKFGYFKDISKIVSVRTEEGEGLLTKEYEKINIISKDTALYKYFNPSDITQNRTYKNADRLIFPFGANKSQFEAVRKALNNQISIIEGPPRNWKNSNYTKHYCKYCNERTNCCSGIK